MGWFWFSLFDRGLEIGDIVSLFCKQGDDFADRYVLGPILSLRYSVESVGVC